MADKRIRDNGAPAGGNGRYTAADTLTNLFSTTTGGVLDEKRIAEALELAETIKKDITVADSIEQGRFDSNGAFTPLAAQNQGIMAHLFVNLRKTIKTWRAFLASDEVQQLRNIFADFNEWLNETAEQTSV